VRRYEALFILNVADEAVKDAIEKVTVQLQSLGCNIVGLQKMDRHNFARVARRKFSSGYYVNFIFDAEPAVADRIKTHFALDTTVFRVMVLKQPEPNRVGGAEQSWQVSTKSS
jgi:ribosomal protein S6